MSPTQFYVYLLTNQNGSVIYTGITRNLLKRLWQHKHNLTRGFTNKYLVHKLVYYEIFNTALEAITREKQIKGGSRKKKLDFIRTTNPLFEDLSENLLR